MEPDFRAFACVELPFRLAPSRSVAPAHLTSSLSTRAAQEPRVSAVEAQAVAAFVPPAVLYKVLHTATGLAGDAEADGGKDARDVDDNDEDEERQRREDKDDATSRARRMARPVRSPSDVPVATRPGEGEASVRLEERYHTNPVFRRRVSTQWESHTRRHAAVPESAEAAPSPALWSYAGDPDDVIAKTDWEADRRREVFPSVEPQLDQEGYLRNDLVVRVVRRKRVRRVRDATTGAVLREEVLPWTESQPRLATRVLGVVSRELLLRRPADFAFAAVTSEEAARAPAVHHTDLFTPGCFLPTKLPFSVGYVPGRDVNTSVLAHQLHLAHLGHSDPIQRALLAEAGVADESATTTTAAASAAESGPDGRSDRRAAGGVGADMEERNLRTLYADPTDSAHFPPAQSDEQREQLRLLGSSVDGSCPDTDPAEVRTLVQLLATRPLWTMRALCEAMLRSGQCPVDHTNRCVIHALTYVVLQGPFNRLRIRLGYDPFQQAALNVRYQLVTVRVMRRSDLGVRLRDASRSAHIGQALQVIRHRNREAQASYQRAHPEDFRGTLLDQCCLMVQNGYLNLSAQLIDLLDDTEIARLVEATPDRALMPVGQRLDRAGWLSSDAQYVRIASHIVDRLDNMVQQEVLPLLQVYEGNAGSSSAGGAGTEAAAEPPQSHAVHDVDEDDDDGHSDDGSMASLSGAASDGSDDRGSFSSASMASVDAGTDHDEVLSD